MPQNVLNVLLFFINLLWKKRMELMKSINTSFTNLVKFVKCYIMPLPRLSYIYWLIYFNTFKAEVLINPLICRDFRYERVKSKILAKWFVASDCYKIVNDLYETPLKTIKLFFKYWWIYFRYHSMILQYFWFRCFNWLG